MIGPGETAPRRGTEGDRKNSQVKGSGHDDTPESAVFPAHQRGNLPQGRGISQVYDGGAKPFRGVLRLFLYADRRIGPAAQIDHKLE